jgi:hypothetical protein
MLLFLATPVAHPSERLQVCAKYRTQYSWSDGYRVEATKATGRELNQATHSFDYNAFSTYVVIFWDRGEASIIEMDWPTISAFGSEGEDMRGVRWEISTSSFCY